MQTKQVKVPPSTTETTVDITVASPKVTAGVTADGLGSTTSVVEGAITVKQSGGTPPVTPPDPTPTPGTRKGLISEILFDQPIGPAVEGARIKAKLGPDLSNEQSNRTTKWDGGQPIRNSKLPGTNIPSMMAILHPQDPMVSSSNRVEASRAGLPGNAANGEERWYGVTVVPEKWQESGGGESFLQFHDNNQKPGPPFSFQIWGGNDIQVAVATGNGFTYYPLGLKMVEGKRMDIVFRALWSDQKNGLLQIWINGAKVLDKVNIQTYLTGGTNEKIGVNKWGWNPPNTPTDKNLTRIIHYANYREADKTGNFDSVNPAV